MQHNLYELKLSFQRFVYSQYKRERTQGRLNMKNDDTFEEHENLIKELKETIVEYEDKFADYDVALTSHDDDIAIVNSKIKKLEKQIELKLKKIEEKIIEENEQKKALLHKINLSLLFMAIYCFLYNKFIHYL